MQEDLVARLFSTEFMPTSSKRLLLYQDKEIYNGQLLEKLMDCKLLWPIFVKVLK